MPALARSNWTLKSSDERSVTFAITLENGIYETDDSAQPQEETVRPFLGAIEITKTFTLADVASDHAYHLDLDLGFSNHSDQIQRLAVRQHGPNSIVNETWWTSTGKTPDVKWNLNDEEDEIRAASIRDQAEENRRIQPIQCCGLETRNNADYVITDSQFFAAGFLASMEMLIGLPVHDFHTELGQLIDKVESTEVERPQILSSSLILLFLSIVKKLKSALNSQSNRNYVCLWGLKEMSYWPPMG